MRYKRKPIKKAHVIGALRGQKGNWLCARCQRRPAIEIDHIIPVAKGGANCPNNLQGLCRQCHAKKTKIDLGYRSATKVNSKGLPLAGWKDAGPPRKTGNKNKNRKYVCRGNIYIWSLRK